MWCIMIISILSIFCLCADVSYFLCCTRKRDVCVTPSLIVFQRPAGFPRSWEHAVIGWHTVRIVWRNADWLLSNNDNVRGDLCNRGFPAKTNQNMCHCVQTVRNLVRGRGKIKGARKSFLYNFTVHDTWHHICKQCPRKLQKRRGLRTRQAFRRKPGKQTKIFI